MFCDEMTPQSLIFQLVQCEDLVLLSPLLASVLLSCAYSYLD